MISYEQLKAGQIFENNAVRIHYATREQYKRITKYMGLMDDFKVSGNNIYRNKYNDVEL